MPAATTAHVRRANDRLVQRCDLPGERRSARRRGWARRVLGSLRQPLLCRVRRGNVGRWWCASRLPVALHHSQRLVEIRGRRGEPGWQLLLLSDDSLLPVTVSPDGSFSGACDREILKRKAAKVG